MHLVIVGTDMKADPSVSFTLWQPTEADIAAIEKTTVPAGIPSHLQGTLHLRTFILLLGGEIGFRYCLSSTYRYVFGRTSRNEQPGKYVLHERDFAKLCT